MYFIFLHVNNLITQPTYKPTHKYELFTKINNFNLNTEEPTESPISMQLPTMAPSHEIKNFTCVCSYDNREKTTLLIATTISSTLCFIILVILIRYRFLLKKLFLKFENNQNNFGIDSSEI
jgi:hypothetical protein